MVSYDGFERKQLPRQDDSTTIRTMLTMNERMADTLEEGGRERLAAKSQSARTGKRIWKRMAERMWKRI